MADTTEKTIAEELKTAENAVREVGGKAMKGPWESLDNGDRLVAWRNVPGTDFDDDFEYVIDEPVEKETAEWIAMVNPDIAEPFADLLREARLISRDHTPLPGYPEPLEWCQQCNDEECAGLVLVRKVRAVARVLNGTTERTGS